MRTQRRQFERARPAVLWTLLGFAAIQFALNAAVVSQHPEVQDSEYVERLTTLRERMAEGPNRPLCLLIGSSRMVDNFAPEKLPPLPAVNGEAPLVFNFAHLGAGPGMNLLVLRRLLREGIRPQWLVIEIMPPQLGDEKQSILYSTANIRDLSITRRLHHPFQVYGDFVRRDLAPCYKYRRLFASRVPGWVPDAELEEDRFRLNPLGGWAKLSPPDPAQARLKTDKARTDYRPALQQLTVTDLSDRAMRELLRLCRHRGIAVVLILSPEGSEFRSWYSPEGLQRVEEYCRNLSRESGVPLVDTRRWLADDEFIDSHHVNVVGAEHFTLRLNQEVLTPLVQGRLATPLSVATK